MQPKWKAGDRVLIEAIVESVFDGKSNWPIKIVLDKGQSETVDRSRNVHYSAIRDPSPSVTVECIEMVDYSTGFEMPADPMWRIEIDGYCTDFSTQTAAQNFADAINRRVPSPDKDGTTSLVSDDRRENVMTWIIAKAHTILAPLDAEDARDWCSYVEHHAKDALERWGQP